MAIRIALPVNFHHYEVASWLNENVGPCEEGVTWFWDHKLTCDSNYYTGPTEYLNGEGVKIWKKGPCQSLAAIKLS